MSLLAIENLRLKIGGEPILDGVSLSLDPGRILALTGESGSGKSMTALSIVRLLPRAAKVGGAVGFDGTDLLGLSERRMCAVRGKSIGMVFQEPMTALNPLRTIGDQVAETIIVHGEGTRREAFERAGALLDRVGLDPGRFPPTRFPHELSGGQRQRVVIAMAIALRPKLLIADEPTTALDVTTQARILDLLAGLVEETGMAMLLITHDLAVVAGIADDIAVMRKGEVVEQGDTRWILSRKRHPYTRALLEASGHRVRLPTKPPSAPLLDVIEVTRDYVAASGSLLSRPVRRRAVRSVSFSLCKGERLGLVGESGSGKSTLARAILGLDPVKSGEIRVEGRPLVPDDRAQRRKMQAVFQDPYGSFNPRHRVGRLIGEPFHLLDEPPRGHDREEAVAEALDAVGLSPDDARKYIHEFSGGQRQRIAIARALIVRPELIVFDEAVSALDVRVRARILDLIAGLCESRSLAYIFISHDLAVVESIADRVLVMHEGAIVEQGEAAQVFSNPRHSYTRSLLAAAPRLPNFSTLEEGDANGS